MENLFGTIEKKENKYLLATGEARGVAISLEPGNGVIPFGAILYCKSGVLYAPAQSAQMDGSKELLILADTVDTTTNAGIAVAAKAYEEGVFLAGAVKLYDGSDYGDITAAQALILRQQNITFRPFDNWETDDVTADNRLALAVAVTYGSNGTASADKATAKKGEVVTLTATPASGYVLDEWQVTAGDVVVGSDGKFTMGDKAVAVKATFKTE